MPKPSEVFTPGELPLRRNNIYVSRATSESHLKRGLERNWCPVVYGDYGVGKTTLVRRYFRAKESPGFFRRVFQRQPKRGRVIYFASASGLSMPKVFETILEHLDYRVEIEQTRSRATNVGAGFSDATLTATVGHRSERQGTSRLVVTAPTDEGMLRIINEAGLTIIIDELHQATDSFRADLVPFIKASRVSAPKSDLVLIGTSADALSLVSSDPGIDRFVADTPVSTMSDLEAQALVVDGFKKLGIGIGDSIESRAVAAASGAPSILQALCLDMAEHAIAAGRRRVDEGDLTFAVKQFIKDRHGRMTKRYITAIETQGEKRYRKRILHAIADLEGDYATMDDIRPRVSVALGEEVPTTALSGPLRDLKTPACGSILQDVERESGGRIQNVTRFTDPMMKSYVRFMATITDTKLVHEDEIREAVAELGA